MADPLYDLLRPHLPQGGTSSNSATSPEISRYLSRIVSLRLNDLTTTEPQSLSQAAHSNLVSLQALSSRSHRTTTTSSDHLSTLRTSLASLSSSVEALRTAIPDLDTSAVTFATSYNRAKDDTTGGNALLNARRETALLARQADKAQDILELPSLLSAAIASASTTSTNANATSTSGTNYTQALDLFAHIKRLQILYPDSQLIKSILADAELAMKDMTTNLIASLRSQNIRLAAAIRMIGWLRRVAPELGTSTTPSSQPKAQSHFGLSSTQPSTHDEGHFGALFLCARLCTFLTMTEALAPLRDLADQETQVRQANAAGISTSTSTPPRPTPPRKASGVGANALSGQQTERYLKRYIEIFREQSFATISMYRNIFSDDEDGATTSGLTAQDNPSLSLTLPPALQSFPLHLVELFMATLKEYLPNVTDPATRESLLMQVLYAANSLGRLGADFSLMIAMLDVDGEVDETSYLETAADPQAESETEAGAQPKVQTEEGDLTVEQRGENAGAEANGDTETNGENAEKADTNGETETTEEPEEAPPEEEKPPQPDPEWIAVIKKHRVQAARLEALAAGQDRVVQRRESSDIAVR
ncbi:Dor1-like family-domain-containing protein [Exophiala viscosa]|uniref:Conserved oligomeric Golgi complex subunit 8 n=1 Tax=Exophiala viscosa TaxID=2486360 RepID=A0AAN6E4C9_9EURO|nr:Dor1-like family-domain-containing protein [Exophiala viscosa]